MNLQVRRMLQSASYDQLERLEQEALRDGHYRLAGAVDEELRSRADSVADSVRNIFETIETLEWPEENG